MAEARRALERGEIVAHFQPQVLLRTGEIIGVEALARWHHPTLGLISPSRFIGLAERAGLMRTLTGWVLEHGLAQLAAWRREGRRPGHMLVWSGGTPSGSLAAQQGSWRRMASAPRP